MPLLWRVFASNAAVLVAATLLLVLSPATVSFPVALTEAVVLVVGLAAMLAVDFVLLRRAFGPLGRLRALHGRGRSAAARARERSWRRADPEVAELTVAFNEMIDRLELERRESARRALAGQEARAACGSRASSTTRWARG